PAPPTTLFPYLTLFRSHPILVPLEGGPDLRAGDVLAGLRGDPEVARRLLESLVAHVAHNGAVPPNGVERVHHLTAGDGPPWKTVDRKSTRLNSSHQISA